MKKDYTVFMLWAFLVHGIFANTIHPITPAFFLSLGYSEFLFGISMSVTSVMCFITSPFWGVFAEKYGAKNGYVICGLGYAIMQLLFGFATNKYLSLLIRFISGAFGGGAYICFMAYIVKYSTIEKAGRNLTYYAMFTSLAISIGYFLGGMLGDISLKIPFYVVFVGVILNVLVIFFFVNEKNQKPSDKEVVPVSTSLNPFTAFVSIAKGATPAFIAVFACVLFANLTFYGFDNGFNYFLADSLGFPTSYNGYLKAGIGVFAVIFNLTLNMWLLKKTDTKKAILPILALGTLFLLASFVATNTALVLAFSVLYFISATIYLPIMQHLLTSDKSTRKSSGELAGIYNAAFYGGMVLGPLISGSVYAINAKLPFGVFCVTFAITTLLGYIYYKKSKAL